MAYCSKLINIYQQEPTGKNNAGGNLHIVIDDYNVEDSDVLFCMEQCKKNNDYLGLEICERLMEMETFDRDDTIEKSEY